MGQSDVVARWLRDKVVPVAAAIDADPSIAIPFKDVFADLRALHAEWVGTDSVASSRR
jgi:hypothetical protein